MHKAPYDSIASEYYDAAHKTSRNFDHTTMHAISKAQLAVPEHGLVLDAGAGRGRCTEFLGIGAKRIIQLDSSANMLKLTEREQCILRVLHDAVPLPFCPATFACVTAFLADGFFGLGFLLEAFRVLQDGGMFIATLPSYEWGVSIRNKINIDKSQTRFVTRTGDLAFVPSTLVPHANLKPMLVRAGFKSESIILSSHALPRGVTPISTDITDAATERRVDINELPIIDLIVAHK